MSDLARRQPEPAARAELPAWARGLTRALDDVVRVPGTRLGIGLDAVIGALLPGAGDAITGVGAAALLVLAIRERVPSAVIARMLFNLLIDVVLGAVPVVGDLFDVVWRSNRKNLELIEQYRGGEKQPSSWDYVLVSLGLVLALVLVLMPLIWVLVFSSIGVSLLGSGKE